MEKALHSQSIRKTLGFWGGLLCFLSLFFLPTPEGMRHEAWRLLACTALMTVWWMTEALPLPITSLTPVFLFPSCNILSIPETTATYANEIIFLFLGGSFLALAMERWNLHRRLALHTIRLVGATPAKLTLGLMCVTAFISMWVSNSATAMMMIPIGLAVASEITGLSLTQLKTMSEAAGPEINFCRALILGIAFAASIGGIGTIIGTPPNTILVNYIKTIYSYEISFVQWMLFGTPLALVLLIATWILLTVVLYPVKAFTNEQAKAIIEYEIVKMSTMTKAERTVLFVACAMALAWLLNGFAFKHVPALQGIHDSSIAIAGATLLFAIPVNRKNGEFLLDWPTASRAPWDILLLFGGGLTLSRAFQATDLTAYIAAQIIQLPEMPGIFFIALVAVIGTILSALLSNTVTATLFIPIIGFAASNLSIHPLAPMLAACLASSCAFILPTSTPPNAIAYGSGCVTIRSMATTGAVISLLSCTLIILLLYALFPLLTP